MQAGTPDAAAARVHERFGNPLDKFANLYDDYAAQGPQKGQSTGPQGFDPDAYMKALGNK